MTYGIRHRQTTSDSTGRMMVNIPMTIAQYERELTTERIRDKVAAAKRRGKHCGGVPVLGYDSSPDKPLLLVNESEAGQVRYIFERFLLFGSAKLVDIDINQQGVRTKSWTTVKGRVREGKPWNTAQVYRVLNNVLYLGKVSHKGVLYDGGRQYQYYTCDKDTKRPVSMCSLKTLPTGDIDRVVLSQLAKLFSTPNLLQQVRKTALDENTPLSRANISEAFSSMAFVWDDLFPVERNRLLRLLVKRVTVEETGLRIEIRSAGLECAIKELQAGK